jgi:hypothetical protein
MGYVYYEACQVCFCCILIQNLIRFYFTRFLNADCVFAVALRRDYTWTSRALALRSHDVVSVFHWNRFRS